MSPSCDPPLIGVRLVLRPPQATDRSAVSALFRAATNPQLTYWWDDFGPDHLADLLAPPTGFHPFVICLQGEIIGLAQFDEETDPKSYHASLDIGLADAFQGQGFGREALQLLIDYLHRRGHHRLMIDPSAGNSRAVALYGKLGFEPIGIIPQADFHHASQTWLDQLLMVRIESAKKVDSQTAI